MKKEELFDVIGNIDEQYIKEAKQTKIRKNGMKLSILAACLCLFVGVIIFVESNFADATTSQPPVDGYVKSEVENTQNGTDIVENSVDPQIPEIVLSEKTTAEVNIGCENIPSYEADLRWLTEEEMFGNEEMYVFRGKVSGLTNITVDFDGMKEYLCIATVVIDKIYQGDLVEGEQIQIVLPCAIDQGKWYVTDTSIIAQIKTGMEAIFMPWLYTDDSYMEMNGKVLMMKDLASCGIADGMRWIFMETDQGLVYEENCYKGANGAETLDDIEKYVMEMLE